MAVKLNRLTSFSAGILEHQCFPHLLDLEAWSIDSGGDIDLRYLPVTDLTIPLLQCGFRRFQDVFAEVFRWWQLEMRQSSCPLPY